MVTYGFLDKNREEKEKYRSMACFSYWNSHEYTKEMEWIAISLESARKLPKANIQMMEEEWFKKYVDEVQVVEGKHVLICSMEHSQPELFLLGTLWRSLYEFNEVYHNEKVSSLINICLNTISYEGNQHLLLPILYGFDMLPLKITVGDIVEELRKQKPLVPFKEKGYRGWSLHNAMGSVIKASLVTKLLPSKIPERAAIFDEAIGHKGEVTA